MKLIKLTNLLVLTLALTFVAVGCKKHPTGLTTLPGPKTGPPREPGLGNTIDNQTPTIVDNTTTSGIGLNAPDRSTWTQDREALKAEIVYFDFDSTAIKANQKSKIQAVADYLKNESGAALKVEGNCDERGTEEYNRSLGERRALAIREHLAQLGIAPDRIETISYGEDKPAVQGHDEAAWSKNRRGEFVVLTPPK
jgi:peptidoglycan-associated lipoprotein